MQGFNLLAQFYQFLVLEMQDVLDVRSIFLRPDDNWDFFFFKLVSPKQWIDRLHVNPDDDAELGCERQPIDGVESQLLEIIREFQQLLLELLGRSIVLLERFDWVSRIKPSIRLLFRRYQVFYFLVWDTDLLLIVGCLHFLLIYSLLQNFPPIIFIRRVSKFKYIFVDFGEIKH